MSYINKFNQIYGMTKKNVCDDDIVGKMSCGVLIT